MAYESPEYRVVDRLANGVEIRDYEPYLVAEVVVSGTIESAGNAGFRILGAYIFGSNQRTSGKSEKPGKGAGRRREGTKISMTSPVTQQQALDGFTVRFMMPSDYSVDSLPAPNDSRIQIREVPGQTLAGIRYSGRWTGAQYDENLELLLDALRAAGLAAIGDPVWARYDPPYKPWFLRRNEILTEFRSDG